MRTGLTKFRTEYNGESWEFDRGSQAFIFDTAVFNGFGDEHGQLELSQFVALVYDVYINSSDSVNLGELAWWATEHWDEVKLIEDRSEIINRFYEEGGDQ